MGGLSRAGGWLGRDPTVRSFLIGLPILAIVLLVAFYYWANGLVYFPVRYPDGPWNWQAALSAADVWLAARDGVKLHGWWIRVPDARLATVFFHGNGGNLAHRAPHMRE